MQQDEWERVDGATRPLGASWIEAEQAWNFALYSKDATAVTLLLYAADDAVQPVAAISLDPIRNKTGRIWHACVGRAAAPTACHYAYRVAGETDPARGLRFDEEKILLDPFARGVFLPPGHDRGAACRPGANDGRAPLGVLPTTEADAAPPIKRAPPHGHDLIIYEMHVRGFTRHASAGIPDAHRGTFAGVVDKLPYLKELGITAVELLPVHQFDPQEGSYWGYMTLNFFAPHSGYASDGLPATAAREFRAMVEALHDAGIEVFLDVVYNHTTEGDANGPTYSFRGIDNCTYYVLDQADPSRYIAHSGCGNDLRTAHPAVRWVVMASLRHWSLEMGVDGFRFDLASIFTRTGKGDLNLQDPPIIAEISGYTELAGLRLIAEPWSGDGSGYVMGRAFPGHNWRQWNDHFRDDVRRFVRGDAGLVPALMTRLYGSTDLLPDDVASAFRRYQSVNYIDCHDGYNLCDLLSYTDDAQYACDYGYRGVADAPPDVRAMRLRQARNFCCLLMLANGTPMFVAGDEFLHTQRGNPNPYDQDNDTTWLDWSQVQENAAILRFFRLMIGFRKAHPAIGRNIGWRCDVTWHGVAGPADFSPGARTIAYHLRGAASGDADLYVMINGSTEPVGFTVQAPGTWRRIVDTGADTPDDFRPEGVPLADPHHLAAPRSIAVLTGGG